MPGLPKGIIKKYGISKRAWQEYRKQRGTTRRAPKKRTKRRVSTVARRRTYRRKRKRSGPNAITKLMMRFKGWFKQGIKILALTGPAAASVMAHGFTPAALGDITQKYVMVDVTTGAVAPHRLIEGWGPAGAAALVLKVLNAVGV